MLALSVSISTSSSPLETESPSDFSHLRIVPSSIESERRGIATSAMAEGLQRSGGGHGDHVGGRPVARRRGRQGEAEDRPAALAAVGPDAPAVALDDLAADRQPDAGALVALAVVQALDHLEHAVAMLGLDADAGVRDGDPHEPAV